MSKKKAVLFGILLLVGVLCIASYKFDAGFVGGPDCGQVLVTDSVVTVNLTNHTQFISFMNGTEEDESSYPVYLTFYRGRGTHADPVTTDATDGSPVSGCIRIDPGGTLGFPTSCTAFKAVTEAGQKCYIQYVATKRGA